jgi:hypothetical protein
MHCKGAYANSNVVSPESLHPGTTLADAAREITKVSGGGSNRLEFVAKTQ